MWFVALGLKQGSIRVGAARFCAGGGGVVQGTIFDRICSGAEESSGLHITHRY